MRFWMIALGCAATASAALAAKPSGFAIPAGRVTYEISSPSVQGKTVLMWAEYGRRFRQNISGRVGEKEKSRPMSGWTVCDGKFIYTHEQSMGKQVVRQDIPKTGAQIPMIGMSNSVGKVVGKETLLGKPCEIREIGTARISVWQNLPLKMVSQSPNGQTFTMRATKLEPGVSVSPTLLQLPAGMQVRNPKAQRLPARK